MSAPKAFDLIKLLSRCVGPIQRLIDYHVTAAQN